MFMHYLALLLEKVADLFPLSMKLGGFSLLVHQIVHQRKIFHLESRRHVQWQWLVFEQAELTMAVFRSTYLLNFDKVDLSSLV